MQLQYDIRELNKLRKKFGSKDVDKALRWATNATTRKAATLISRDIRDVFTIKARDIKSHLQIRKYQDDATRALLYTGRRIPLAQFAPKTKNVRTTATSKRGKRFKTRRRGVTIRKRKDVGRKLVAGGWYAKDSVFRRQDASDNTSTPIPQYGPSIPGMVAHPETINQAQEFVRRDLPKQFSERLDYLLNKA